VRSGTAYFRGWGTQAGLTGPGNGTHYTLFDPDPVSDICRDQFPLLPEWNSLSNWNTVRIPAGTTVYIGPASGQEGYNGGVPSLRPEALRRAMASILESLAEGLTIAKYSDWVTFAERLDRAVRSGRVREIPVLKPVHGAGTAYKWFLDPETDEVYGYVLPNPPVYPRWEKVDVLKQLEASDPAPLSGFKTGPITVMMAHIMKLSIEALVARGLVEALPTPASAPRSKDRTERWYKDRVSNVVYRLSEYYPVKGADEIRWEVVPQAELSRTVH